MMHSLTNQSAHIFLITRAIILSIHSNQKLPNLYSLGVVLERLFFYLSSCLIMQWISFILILVSFLLWQVLWILWLQEHCVTITKCKMEIFPKKGYPVSSLPARRKSIFMIERRQLLASQSNVSKGVNCHSAGGQISV